MLFRDEFYHHAFIVISAHKLLIFDSNIKRNGKYKKILKYFDFDFKYL